ncbi:MAG: stage II sporulation protein R [Ruminococcaceae bacterium]|nr:stage II sporulation protein R [Oscillospiraceae bacterium]
MKKILTFVITVCLIISIIGLMPVHGEEKIYDSVMRLHVIANSDSNEDQALKLCVRDAILSRSDLISADCADLEEAKERTLANLEEIQKCAKAEVERLGYSYEVEVRLCEEDYPTKTYGSLCFPSGKYLSLQVLIGEAKGENWWCVLFPPLCLDAASKAQTNEDAFIAVGLTPEQYKVITETKEPAYEARFKILEALEEAF